MRKILLRITITVILIFGVLVSVPLILSVLNKGEIAADIHKIEKASSPYLFKYHSSTFELLAGEKNDNPRLTLMQGKRSLDINITPAQQKPAPKPKQPQTQPSPTTQPDGNVDQEPPAEDINPVEETETQDTSFFPIGTVNASESVRVINPNTKPAIEYINGSTTSDVIITPNQQKVTLTFDIESTPKAFPILNINPKKMVPRQDGDEIIFMTRTRREAFSLKNTTLTDKKGAKTNVGLVLNSISKDNFNITFNINSDWLTNKSRVYPLTLTVAVVSLFHDRMVSASPTKPDFAATEKPEFIIDISKVEEPLRSALLARDYSKLKIGAIDASGKGKRMSSELVPVANGNLKLRFTVGGSQMKPGLYDLLIQYQDDPSFIGEEEFSWGVLVMNPDQAIYKPGQKAKIDMAVLNELGHIVCNADLVLEITDPTGNVATRTTNDGSIEVSSGCFLLETDLPDYTTNYDTSSTGDYNMKLTATTVNGSFVINDKFIVDPNSPFYVKRVGPTRIFPPKTYTMNMSIEANQNASKIIETVPSNFEIEDSSEFSLSQDGKQTLTWKKKLQKGDRVQISYKFKGPNISPALFFVGPVQIGTWKEPRVWQVAFDAIETLRPNAVGTYQEWDLVDTTHDGATSDQSDATYIETGVDEERDIQNLDDTTFSASDTINSITVYITCKGFGGGAREKAATLIREGGTDTEGGATNTNRTSFVDISTIYATNPRTAAAWQQSEIDALEAGARLKTIGGGETVQCSEIRVDVDYTPAAAGPTNDQLMRHGKWFDGSAAPEQPMTF